MRVHLSHLVAKFATNASAAIWWTILAILAILEILAKLAILAVLAILANLRFINTSASQSSGD